MKPITINLLTTNRPHFFDVNFHYFNKIKDENKKQITLNILSNDNLRNWSILEKLSDGGLQTNLVTFPPGNNYMQKINYAVTNSSYYCVSMDEDCFLNNHVWDYMIENANILNDSSNLLLTPLLSNSIPSFEMFVESIFTEEEKKELYDILLNVDMPFIWGVDYSYLNKHTLQKLEWDSDAFYESVSHLNHHYKGIHPVRVSKEAHILLHKFLLKHKEEFPKKRNYFTAQKKITYLCNNLYMIKTDVWRKILTDKSLFRDAFDEVPLNLYKDRHDLNCVFIDDCFGIHVAYNCVPGHIELENEFFNNFKDIVKEEK